MIVYRKGGIMFVNRDYTRNIHDDFELNIMPHLTSGKEAIPLYHDDEIIGWEIKNRYE